MSHNQHKNQKQNQETLPSYSQSFIMVNNQDQSQSSQIENSKNLNEPIQIQEQNYNKNQDFIKFEFDKHTILTLSEQNGYTYLQDLYAKKGQQKDFSLKSTCLNFNLPKGCKESLDCKCDLCEIENQKYVDKGHEYRQEIFKNDQQFLQEYESEGFHKRYIKKQQQRAFNEKKQQNTNQQQKTEKSEIDKDLNFVLQRLQPPQKFIQSLRINIQETICFSKWEVSLVIYTSNNKHLKFMKQKEKLNLQELRKFMVERRNQYKNNINIGEAQQQAAEQKISMQQSMKIIKNKILQQQEDNTKTEAVILKTFLEIEEFDNTVQVQNPKQQKNNINQQQQTQENQERKVSYQFFQQVLCETEFLNLMMKRKIDPIWHEVMWIQNFMPIKRGQNDFIKIQFNLQYESNEYLYKRAGQVIQVMGGEISNISQDYISNEFELDFEQKIQIINPQEYCRYMIYKIVQFIKVFYGPQITKLMAHWVLDDMYDIYLMDIFNLEKNEKIQDKNEDDEYKSHLHKLKLDAEQKLSQPLEIETKYRRKEKDLISNLFSNLIRENELKKRKAQLQLRNKNKKSDENREVEQRFNSIINNPQPIQELKKYILGSEDREKELKSKNKFYGQGLSKSVSKFQNTQNIANRNELPKEKADAQVFDLNFKAPCFRNQYSVPFKIKYNHGYEFVNRNIRIPKKIYKNIAAKSNLFPTIETFQ